MAKKRAVIVIPARYASTRLPGKVLLKETGKFLVQHVYERALEVRGVDEVILATDDDRVVEAARAFGAAVVKTSSRHRSGTDRIEEAVRRWNVRAPWVINLQADEPEFQPAHIEELIDSMNFSADFPVGTLVAPLQSGERLNPHVVKACLVPRRRASRELWPALFFLRTLPPAPGELGSREVGRRTSDVGRRTVQKSKEESTRAQEHKTQVPNFEPQTLNSKLEIQNPSGVLFWHHVGVYAYRRAFLKTFVSLKPGAWEEFYHLEQFRVLEHGYRLGAHIIAQAYPGIDTLEDYRSFVERCPSLSIRYT